MLILDLCGGTGAWSQPYKDAGYCVDVVDLPRDVRLFRHTKARVQGILAAPPCTVFSYARNRYDAVRECAARRCDHAARVRGRLFPSESMSLPAPRPIAEWSPERLACALIVDLCRWYDAGGLSHGRSLESELAELARELLRPHRPTGDLTEWPDRRTLIEEARDRIRAEAGVPRAAPQ